MMTWFKPRPFQALLLALSLGILSSASAQESITTDEPVDKVARLSDAEVRALLLRELEEKQQAAAGGHASVNPAMTSIQIQKQVSWLGGQLAAKFGAVGELPDVWRQATQKLSAPRRRKFERPV